MRVVSDPKQQEAMIRSAVAFGTVSLGAVMPQSRVSRKLSGIEVGLCVANAMEEDWDVQDLSCLASSLGRGVV